jgi:hypothetical protein
MSEITRKKTATPSPLSPHRWREKKKGGKKET